MAAPDAMPPKTRAALIGALLLVLGVASGSVLMTPSTPGVVSVEVPGALQTSVACGAETAHTSEPGVPVTLTPASSSCAVSARMSDERLLHGPLELGSQPRARCVPDGDVLLCGAAR